MKNIVNRALVAKKKQFQSKSVPRGTRTIWRYLGALFLLFTFGIGNVWADTFTASDMIVQNSGKTAVIGTTKNHVTVYSPGITSTSSQQIWKDGNTAKKETTVVISADASNSDLQNRSGSYIEIIADDGYTLGTTIGIRGGAKNSSAKIAPIVWWKTTVSSTIDGGKFDLSLPENTITSSSGADLVVTIPSGMKIVRIYRKVRLDKTTHTKFQTSNYDDIGGGSAAISSITATAVADCQAVAPGNISKGALSAGELTLNADGTPAAKNVWYWQTSATGTSKDNSGTSFNVSAAGTYYVRSLYDNSCWSDAKSFTVTATDLVANYTVVYKDGTTELGNEVIAVDSHPEGIADPKKDCYTFAGWMNGTTPVADVTAISGTKDEVITLTASWTPNYASGAYVFQGTPVTTSKTAATIFNGALYFSAMDATLDTGDASYYGWKIKTNNATVKFLVQYASKVKITLKEKSALNVTFTPLEGAETTETASKSATKTILVKAGTMVTLTTTTDATTTLNRIEIAPLYNATYTDGKGDASGNASNVTEVTLPTPSATTVGGYSFTGWVADKTVYKGETAKTAGSGLDAGETYTLTTNTEFTAQWQLISDFDVKFYQGYGDPDVQIGDKQTISTGNFAVAPTDPERAGFAFLGWSYDATEAHIVDVATYGITAATNFTAMWKAVWTVTFDGAGNVEVQDGTTVASPNSPVMAKVFQGWYNGESKYDFSAAVTGNLALTSKWADADPNHYVYAYNDDFHFDGVVYKTPEGKTTDPEASEATLNLTTPYTLFSGAEGITSIVATKAVYDYKKGDNTKHITAYLKLKKSSDDANSKLIFTIASGYTAVLKVKMGGYSKTPTVTLKKGDDAVTGTPAAVSGKAEDKDYAEITYNLVAGVYEMTTADQTLYFSHIDLQATALPTFIVTYVPGEGTGDEVVDNDATMVADCPNTFTAPTGTVFNGWKNENDNTDVEVGAAVATDMNLIAQWINVYAVTFNMNGHGAAIDPQDVKEGAKAAKPADPSESGWIFGGWFTDNGTFEVPFDFNTLIIAATPLYAKWTEDPCPTPFSLSKVVLTSATDGTVTGYNNEEYAGEKVIGGLNSTETAEVDPSHEGVETGYKLNNGGSAIVFATLKKGTFQEGDRVVVTITKKQDAYKVEEVSQPILDIYYGTNKDDATFLTTIDNVTAAGSYTYRLTAADVTAIGTKKGIGVFRPSSGRTQNPYVYSVEIQGCRSWAVSHGVTFNMMGHGAQVDPQSVPEGDLLTKPTVVEPEGWAFVGWYKENTLENEWDFTTDVMGTSDMTLYAKWEDEAGVIKLFSSTGDLNTANFVSAAKADDPIVIDEVPYPTLVAFGSNRSDLKGTTPADMVQYNAATNAAKIKLDLYNNNSGAKSAYLWMVEEGDETATPIEISIPGKERVITSYYTFNSEKNRSFYLTSDAKSDIKVLQVKVMDNGTAIHQFGQAGYSVNFNKGRIGAAAAVAIPFEGAIISADAYSVLNSSNLKPKNYIQFNNAVANTVIRITKSSSNAYYVTNDLEEKGDSYTTDKEIVLPTTGTWYIGSVNPGSLAAFTKIEFIAPKCEQPTVVDMENIGLCEGDAFIALNVSANVADGGTLHYQWYKHPAEGDDEEVGTDAASYTPTADGQYYVVVTNKLSGYTDNAKMSNMVTVAHFASAAITTAPENQRKEAGQVATLTVVATGKAPLTYQWYKCDEAGNNPVIIDGADEDTYEVTVTAAMSQYYKVVVGSGCGSAEAVALVEEWHEVTPANVTGSITWNWAGSAWDGISGDIAFDNTGVEQLMANVSSKVPVSEAGNFRADMLYGTGKYVWRSGNKFFQGTKIRFITEVPGFLIVHYRNTSGSANTRKIEVVNNGETLAEDGTSTTNNWKWTNKVFVQAGEVILNGIASEADGLTRIDQIVFNATPDYSRPVSNNIGTLCVDHNVPAGQYFGATFYQIASRNEQYNDKIDFEEVLPNEELKAGEPYIFKSTTGKIELFYGETEAENPVPVRGMIGSFVDTQVDIDEENKSNILYIASNKLWNCEDLVGGHLEVVENRAYINMSGVPTYAEYQEAQTSNPAPRRRVTLGRNAEQVATGIEDVQGDKVQCTKMLINGQLFILRGEKMYDAKGQLVK